MSERFFRSMVGDGLMPIADWTAATELDIRDFGEGVARGYASDDAMITITDAKFARCIKQRSVLTTDALLVRASLYNSCAYVPDGNTWSFQRPVVAVSALPRGTVLEIDIAAGVRQCSVTVLLDPRSLLLQHGLQAADLPEPLQRLVEGDLDRPHTALTMPVPADIASLVQDVLHSRLTGALHRMQVQGRASELLALVAASWKERLESHAMAGARGRRDAEILTAARRILCERFTEPPTLTELARELGTNKNKLNQLFQQNLGTTALAYSLQQRMGRAQALLGEGKLNISQVADAVGYQHQSSFAAAFREAVGESPREFARRSRPTPAMAMH